MTAFGSLKLSNRERDDSFCQVVVQLAPRWRVIVCKDHLQWIIQKRTAEPLHRGEWRGQSYVTSRNSLIRLCASLACNVRLPPKYSKTVNAPQVLRQK